MLDLWDWILLLLFGNFLFELLVLYDELCVVFFCLEFKFFCLSKGDDKWCCCMVFVVGDILVLFEDCCIWNWVCFLGEVVLFCVCFGCLLFLFELIFFVLVFCFLLLNCFVGIFGFMLFFFGKFCFLLIFFEIFFFDEWLFLIFLGKEFKLVFLNVFFFIFSLCFLYMLSVVFGGIKILLLLVVLCFLNFICFVWFVDGKLLILYFKNGNVLSDVLLLFWLLFLFFLLKDGSFCELVFCLIFFLYGIFFLMCKGFEVFMWLMFFLL